MTSSLAGKAKPVLGLYLSLLGACAVLLSGCLVSQSPEEPRSEPVARISASPEAASSAAEADDTATPSPTATVAPLPTPTATPSPTATVAPLPTPTATPSPTATVAPLPTPTAMPSPTATTTPLPTPTATPTQEPTAVALTPMTKEMAVLAITVAQIPSDIPEYERSQWKHWIDEDGDCQDARQEVLISESLVELTFETARNCRVGTGRWYGAFSGTYVESPGDLDIDHLVPLKNAHVSGGWAWTSVERQEYANYLGDSDHLIAVTKAANRSKGAKGPEDWRPPDEGYWCQYATDWAEVKMEWGLTMTQRETDAIIGMLDTCGELVQVVTITAEGTPTPTRESEDISAVYGSCEEAENAGETRVQGSVGPGRGFPREMVPDARDGDGDGVVCER